MPIRLPDYKECISHGAHDELRRFTQSLEQWQQRRRSQASTQINTQLLVLPTLKSDCWRFFYRMLNALRDASPQVVRMYSHYWEALGGAGGRVLELSGDELSEEILKGWTTWFLEAGWPTRPLIVRAFTDIGPKCRRWDSGLKEALQCFRVLCEKPAEVLTSKLAKPVGDTMEWLFDIWKQIAARCQEERRSFLHENHHGGGTGRLTAIETTACAILDEAFSLFAMYDRADDLQSSNASTCRTHWQQMLFEFTIPSEKWKTDEIQMVATPRVRNSYRRFLDQMSEFVRAASPDKLKRYDLYVAGLTDGWERYFENIRV